MRDKDIIKEKIKELIQRYNNLKKEKGVKGLGEISEANVRSDFIDDLFAILEWNVKNPDEYDRENYVRGVGYADVALKIDKKPVIFVEAKRFGSIPEVNRGTTDWIEEERQVMNYAASPERRIKWAILTNFEKFRVFNALNGLLVLEIKAPWEYEERLEELLYLSKDAVKDGLLDRLETRKERPDVDERFLVSLNKWRLMLANDIYEKNKDNNVLKDENGNISLDKLKSAVQRVLDRLIVVRYAEDTLILENPDQLKALYKGWLSTRPYSSLRNSLMDFFKGFDKIHNSKLFQSGHICEEVEIGSEILGKIIEDLYEINFRKFDFDILGNTYESYLGNTLYLENGKIGLKPSQETRKESGIYYTPPYVVDYIVKNTVGEILKNKKPEEVQKIKVLDPACGSGSFLIKAYDYFKEYYEKENERRRKEIEKKIKEYIEESGKSLHIFDNSGYELIKGYEKKILNENIYGVDLDEQAAEIASVNLVLKALKKGEKLPLILGENIRVGNSLISGSEEELKKYFGDEWKKKKPFNWEEEFPDVFDPNLPEAQRGFDVVIGNPPYIRTHQLSEDERRYFNDNFSTAYGQYDIFILFIELGLNLLREGGKLGFIISSKFATSDYGVKLREFILNNCVIEQEVDLSTIPVFGDASVYPYILILRKESNAKKRDKNNINAIVATDAEEFAKGSYDIRRIPQSRYKENAGFVFDIISEKYWKIIKKLEKETVSLGQICTITRGFRPPPSELVVPGYKYNQLPPEMKKFYKKFISGGELDGRYSINWNGNYLKYDMKRIKESKPAALFDEPKIMIRDISTHPSAYYDGEGYFPLKTIYTIHRKDESYDLRYITAIINSNIMRFYTKAKFWYAHIGGEYLRFRKQYLTQLPIKSASSEIQQEFTQLVDKMLSLNKELNSINVDFEHYVDLYPRVKDITLERYLQNLNLDASDKEVLNNANRIEGKVTGFEIIEKGEWLVFKIEYEKEIKAKNKIDKVEIRAFRCGIKDEKMRKFLYYSIKEFITPGKVGKGNLYERILKIKIPCFNLNWEKNVETIQKIMEEYLPNVEKWEKLKKEIEETDRKIDQKVYELYGLTEEEIKIVEESLL